MAIKIVCKTEIQEKSNNYQQFRLSKSGQWNSIKWWWKL